MAENTDREIKDFMIECAVRSVMERRGCEIKHGRTLLGFVEYAKWEKTKKFEDMVVDYLTSDKEHYSELVAKKQKLKEEIAKAESSLERIGE